MSRKLVSATTTDMGESSPRNATVQDEDTLSASGSSRLEGAQVFRYAESRKLGVTSSVFLILNKMIGTGS